jgi:hypothetical protein
VWRPYFNRAPEHFSSHNQTPVDCPTGHPVAALSADGRIAYVYAALFEGYRKDAFYIYKELIARMLATLLPDPAVVPGAGVPASMEISLLRQTVENRLVAHLINFHPQRRTSSNEYIEDAVPLKDVSFAVRTGESPARVVLAPSREPLAFLQDGAYCHVTVPAVSIHQMVAFEGV